MSLYQIVAVMLRLYEWTLLASVILSWLPVDRYNPIVRFIDDMTEPVFRPFRRLIPPVGGLDFSPIVVFFVYGIVARFILQVIGRLGI